MAAGELNNYAGRVVSVYEDIEELKQTAKKAGDPDFYKLRLQKQAGYFPTNRLLDDILDEWF